jgi:hypothetical protein
MFLLSLSLPPLHHYVSRKNFPLESSFFSRMKGLLRSLEFSVICLAPIEDPLHLSVHSKSFLAIIIYSPDQFMRFVSVFSTGNIFKQGSDFIVMVCVIQTTGNTKYTAGNFLRSFVNYQVHNKNTASWSYLSVLILRCVIPVVLCQWYKAIVWIYI